jgi:prevent-host-death family protein
MQIEVGIRELKAQLSAYLRRVKAGETVIVTDWGRPIGRIVPLRPTTDGHLESLTSAGLVTNARLVAWNGQRLAPLEPLAKPMGEMTISDLLLSNRR